MKERTNPTPPKTSDGVETFIARTVITVMALIAVLTFAFSFGNVWHLAARLGVPAWIAPLVGPAVDLSVVGLLLGIQYAALRSPNPTGLRPARALLVFSGLATLGLNIADPLAGGQYGKAALDAVAPLLLIGWSEVGPGLLRQVCVSRCDTPRHQISDAVPRLPPTSTRKPSDAGPSRTLLDRARHMDLLHREQHGRPISSENLRRELAIGTATARQLAAELRGLSA